MYSKKSYRITHILFPTLAKHNVSINANFIYADNVDMCIPKEPLGLKKNYIQHCSPQQKDVVGTSIWVAPVDKMKNTNNRRTQYNWLPLRQERYSLSID